MTLGTLKTFEIEVWHEAIAAAVRNGVTFEAYVDSTDPHVSVFIIEYTGGY